MPGHARPKSPGNRTLDPVGHAHTLDLVVSTRSAADPYTAAEQLSIGHQDKMSTYGLSRPVTPAERDQDRYWYYVENGIDDDAVSPLDEQWIENTIARVSRVARDGTDQSLLVEQLVAEMTADYTVSLKKSILDYVLRDAEEQARLRIAVPPRATERLRESHYPWHTSVEDSRKYLTDNLHANHEIMLDVLRTWCDISHVLCVDT
eukprot:Opistho-2@68204